MLRALKVAFTITALLAVSGAQAAPVTGSCAPTKIRFVASDDIFQIDSTNFANAREGTVKFTQGGTRASCVIVSVSAQPVAFGSGVLTVRVMLDNTQLGLPAEVSFSDGNDVTNQVRSFDFIFPDVAPGAHTVRLQAKTSDPAQFTDLNRHNIIVQYAP